MRPKRNRKPMAELPEHQNGIESRSFLLTLLRDGRVRAERIRAEDDPRLHSKAPFALITVDSFLLTEDERNLADAAGWDAGRLVDGVDEGYLLRQRIAESIEDFHGLFHALRDATEDTMLQIDRMDRSGAEWRICTD